MTYSVERVDCYTPEVARWWSEARGRWVRSHGVRWRWAGYWRVRLAGRVVNTFLTKARAVAWIRDERRNAR